MAPSSGEASGANYMRTSFLENIQSVIFRRSPTKEPPATSSPSLAPNSSSRPGSDRRGEQQLQRQGEEEEEDKEDVASQASLATATPGTVGNTAVANTQSRVGLHLEPSTSPLTPMSTAAPNTQGASTVGRAEQPPAPLQTASTVSPSRPGKERHTVEDPNDEDSPVKRQRVTSAPELIQDVPSSSQRARTLSESYVESSEATNTYDGSSVRTTGTPHTARPLTGNASSPSPRLTPVVEIPVRRPSTTPLNTNNKRKRPDDDDDDTEDPLLLEGDIPAASQTRRMRPEATLDNIGAQEDIEALAVSYTIRNRENGKPLDVSTKNVHPTIRNIPSSSSTINNTNNVTYISSSSEPATSQSSVSRNVAAFMAKNGKKAQESPELPEVPAVVPQRKKRREVSPPLEPSSSNSWAVRPRRQAASHHFVELSSVSSLDDLEGQESDANNATEDEETDVHVSVKRRQVNKGNARAVAPEKPPAKRGRGRPRKQQIAQKLDMHSLTSGDDQNPGIRESGGEGEDEEDSVEIMPSSSSKPISPPKPRSKRPTKTYGSRRSFKDSESRATERSKAQADKITSALYERFASSGRSSTASSLSPPSAEEPSESESEPYMDKQRSKARKTTLKGNNETAGRSTQSKAKSKPRQSLPANTSPNKGQDKGKGKAKARQSLPNLQAQVPQKSVFDGLSDDSSSSLGLPDFPSSSFPGASQPQWDLSLLDESVFVTLPAKRKGMHEDDAPEDDSPKFWWPARIVSRNLQKFTVRLVIDKPKQEILKFSSSDVIIPHDQLTEDNIKSFADSFTGQLSFADLASASRDVREDVMSSEYLLPTDAAFKSAIRQGKKENDDSLPDVGGVLYNSPPKKSLPSGTSRQTPTPRKKSTSRAPRKELVRSRSQTSEDDGDLFGDEGDSEIRRMLAGVNSSQLQVGDDSDSDELDPEIEVGTTGLAKVGADWWPARVVEILPVPKSKYIANGRGRPIKKRPKNGPYKVETYPSGIYKIWRSDFQCFDDADFCTVPLGQIRQTSKDTALNDEELHSVLPAMAELTAGKYDPGLQRHELFFGTQRERDEQLPLLVVYGEFTDVQVASLSQFLRRWLDGKVRTEHKPRPCGEVMLLADNEVTEYISGVLVPTALELLFILTNDEVTAEARANLEARGLPIKDDDVRVEAHRIAAAALSQETQWYQKIYTARQLRANANSIRSKTDFNADSSFEDGTYARRSKKKDISYRE